MLFRSRKEDIVLLFRKFGSDFAEKYRMPPIKLTDDAKILLSNYYWNGNVRQLKNITEQISVIEQQREISAHILRSYLPKDDVDRLPALFSSSGRDNKSFNSEREILYQVLFDMKKDMSELKKIVHSIINGQQPDNQQKETVYTPTFISNNDYRFTSPTVNNEYEY